MAKKTRTPDEVRKDLRRRGLSVAAFARQHGLPQQTIRDLLSEKAKGHRGLAHRAAVLLGLKDGVLDDAANAGSSAEAQAA